MINIEYWRSKFIHLSLSFRTGRVKSVIFIFNQINKLGTCIRQLFCRPNNLYSTQSNDFIGKHWPSWILFYFVATYRSENSLTVDSRWLIMLFIIFTPTHHYIYLFKFPDMLRIIYFWLPVYVRFAANRKARRHWV